MQIQPISVRQAAPNDLSTVSSILLEATLWLQQQNKVLWEESDVSPDSLRKDTELGLFYIAFCGNTAAGVVKFQTEDLVFWLDVPQENSAFIHKLAVRRSFAGGSVLAELKDRDAASITEQITVGNFWENDYGG